VKEWSKEELYLLGQVLPRVAQHLRMPLNNLALSAQQLSAHVDESESGKRADSILQQSYYRMLRLVNNLDFAPRLLEDTLFYKENVDIVAWLDALCLQAEGLFAEKGVSLRFECEPSYHIIALHKEYLERLVWNLLNNALKFTPDGGTVTVSLKTAGSQLLLTVADTGCGISDEQMETVFDRWLNREETDAASYGLGLGLPLCRRIAEGHGGRLLLSSQEGSGTTVTVSLPDVTVKSDTIHDRSVDFEGGFSPVLVELSDGLPYTVFTSENLDL